jgi:mannose-6-phosphate isomerase-like protein (cupin superfamily)
MRKIFSQGKGVQVPDGTKVFSLLNCLDSTSGLPGNLLEDFSLTVGEIEPGRQSRVHVMPLVTQVTFVLQGKLEVWMKDRDQLGPYSLRLEEEQAILTRPGTFLQFRNHSGLPCRVLYIVSPAYLFVMEKGKVVYDDSVVLEEDWEELEKINWKPAKLRSLDSIRKDRQAAKERFAGLSR